MPSWDNSARRQNSSTIIYKSDPHLFEVWTRYIRSYNLRNFKQEERFIFINAWNEWGEGCHLEPDQKYGLQYLEAFLKSASSKYSFESFEKIKEYSLKIINKKITNQIKTNISKNYPKAFEISFQKKSLIFKIDFYNLKNLFVRRLIKLPYLFKLTKTLYNILIRFLKYFYRIIKTFF